MNAMVKRRVHVAAAAIISSDGREVLLARRPSNVDHGGLWEFPGGKLAPTKPASRVSSGSCMRNWVWKYIAPSR